MVQSFAEATPITGIQARSVRGATCALCALLTLLLSACTGGSGKAKASGPPEKEAAVPVQVFTVESRVLRRTVEAVGSLFPYDEVVVSSEVDGRAEKVLVDVGDQIAKGQTLVEILPT